MKLRTFLLAFSCLLAACTDVSNLEQDLANLEERIAALEDAATQANDNAVSLKALMSGKTIIVGRENTDNGYKLSLSDGTVITIIQGATAPGIVPVVGVDEAGNWVMSTDGGKTFSQIAGSTNIYVSEGATPQVRIDSDGFWQISMDKGESWNYIYNAAGMKLSASDGNYMTGSSSVFSNVEYDEAAQTMTFTLKTGTKVTVKVVDSFSLVVKGYLAGTKLYLEDKIEYEVVLTNVASTMIKAPQGWVVKLTDRTLLIETPASGTDGTQKISIITVSPDGYLKNVELVYDFVAKAASASDCRVWQDFVERNSNNMLLDFSYAGYDHGVSCPPDVSTLGYKTFDVTDYGAVPNDGKSDREAFLKAYQAALGSETAVQNPSACAIIYFPPGEYILHSSADDTNGKSSAMDLRAGNLVIKGAGRDLTTISMEDPMLPTDATILYSSPVMLELKHYSGMSKLTDVTGNAAKGSFSVDVASTAGIAKGDYVCLYVMNNDAAFVAEELYPYSLESGMTNLKDNGVTVTDYHQVKEIKGNTLTFEEPIMHQVESKWGWIIQKYYNYSGVGVEDITFKGKAKNDFKHHGSWQDDGAYKPLAFSRITNGWIRRCRFTSVSEACSVTNSANISVYDIIFDGNRGHAAIRSAGSSRVFIGATKDISDGPKVSGGAWMVGAGQYHAVGVSKPSMGAVLWRNEWGGDSCFESHATQPRATLIDCCKGGWMQSRQGGDAAQVPNHLNDLTIWNFESTTLFGGVWNWYDVSGKYWKFVMPLVVGFHGADCNFNASQCKLLVSSGAAVNPESLYESQLKLRLGYVPAWLNSLK